MKRLSTILLLAGSVLNAQGQSKLAGNWQGTLNAGQSLRLVFHVKETAGNLSATMDSPDQGVTGIPCASVYFKSDSVVFDLGRGGVMYTGRMFDATMLTGNWHQGGLTIPVDLKKTDKPAQVFKPQTPKSPFIYNSEDVVFQNADKSIQYGATITIPKESGTYPAVLLISGSGPQNRDEEILGHKPFAVIADYLTNHGYIVLRVDDRGVNQTTGDRTNSTSMDYAKDAEAALNYLKTRKEVNTKKIGMLGHSEGGLIAPIIASERKDINFIILAAAPGVKITELMALQNDAVLRSSGADSTLIKHYGILYRNIENDIINAKDSVDAYKRIAASITDWKNKTPKETVQAVGMVNEDAEKKFINEFVGFYNNRWYNSFMKFNPQPYLEKLSCKVLAINGDKDIQVVSSQNLPAIQTALEKSKSKVYTVKEFSGLNHLFQHCKTCSTEEYGTLEETFAPEVLQYITDWMDKNVN